ncbi:MAG: alpha/beta hydrolase [Flavobacteriales bacterium]|jgi:phospholipase/carboxylesterase|tara:strand:- start:15424 stop:16053 length:630 start_codon:yes stop_codon:yes gene_type:complete
MLEYRIRNAEGNAIKKPVIFLIHGYGSNADDLFSFAPYLPKSHVVISLQAPLALGNESFAWYQLGIDSTGAVTSEINDAWNVVDLLIENIESLLPKNSLDPNDISLFGFSQGAIISWALAFQHPKKVRRIIALSGLIHDSVPTSSKPEFIAYAAHGTSDSVIPVESARKHILPLSHLYKEIQYQEFPDGHEVSQENFKALIQWINKTNL